MTRTAELTRATKETSIEVTIDLDGSGLTDVSTGIPFYDTVSTVVWKQLRMAGVDTRQVKGWGRLFQEVE